MGRSGLTAHTHLAKYAEKDPLGIQVAQQTSNLQMAACSNTFLLFTSDFGREPTVDRFALQPRSVTRATDIQGSNLSATTYSTCGENIWFWFRSANWPQFELISERLCVELDGPSESVPAEQHRLDRHLFCRAYR